MLVQTGLGQGKTKLTTKALLPKRYKSLEKQNDLHIHTHPSSFSDYWKSSNLPRAISIQLVSFSNDHTVGQKRRTELLLRQTTQW